MSDIFPAALTHTQPKFQIGQRVADRDVFCGLIVGLRREFDWWEDCEEKTGCTIFYVHIQRSQYEINHHLPAPTSPPWEYLLAYEDDPIRHWGWCREYDLSLIDEEFVDVAAEASVLDPRD